MTRPYAHPAPAATPEEIERGGRGISAAVDMDAINTLLAGLPTSALMAELDAIVEVIDASDTGRARRRAGLLGRLLGRDLVARANPDATADRVRVHLAHAAEHAGLLASHLSALEAVYSPLQQQIDAMDAFVEASRNTIGPAPDEPDPRHLLAHRHLERFQAVGVSWRHTRAQVRMAVDHVHLVLDRYRKVRDLLVPLWRQHHAGGALEERLRERLPAGENDRQALHRLIASLQTSPPTTHTPTHPNPADREPSP